MPVLEGVDVVALGEEVQCVGDEDDGLAVGAQGAEDGVGEQGFADMCVD